MNFYRGIKYNHEDIKTENAIYKTGIYRGFKHDPIKVKSKPMPYGVYRGVKWTA